MLLYIVRHAWAEERNADQWPDDSLRPLTANGRKRFAQVLKRLAEADFAPASVATSPYVRCRQTAELIAERIAGHPKIESLDALMPGSDLQAALQWSAGQKEDQIAWVGHAPDVEDLAARLIGEGQTAIRFAKGSVAAIRFESAPALGGGVLQWLATAKLLGV